MGIHEIMPPGFIQHGGPGSEYPCIIMFFHSPTKLFAGQKWLPAQNRMVVWDYEAKHQYGNNSEEWDHSWLQISGKWMTRMLRKSTIPLGIPLHLSANLLPMRYLAAIYEELRSRTEQDPDMLTGLLQVFWHDLTRHLNADPHIRFPDSRLDHAREVIEENFVSPFNLVEVASKAHLSTSHFCSVFSKRFGVPPREYAMQLRLQRATQLLANHDLAIFQVAEMIGFDDPLYFSKLFHRRYGISPRQFRQQQ